MANREFAVSMPATLGPRERLRLRDSVKRLDRMKNVKSKDATPLFSRDPLVLTQTASYLSSKRQGPPRSP